VMQKLRVPLKRALRDPCPPASSVERMWIHIEARGRIAARPRTLRVWPMVVAAFILLASTGLALGLSIGAFETRRPARSAPVPQPSAPPPIHAQDPAPEPAAPPAAAALSAPTPGSTSAPVLTPVATASTRAPMTSSVVQPAASSTPIPSESWARARRAR
jgi:hypothetical protein